MSAILQYAPEPLSVDPQPVTANITVDFDPSGLPNNAFTFSGTGVTDNVFRVADDVTSVTVNLAVSGPVGASPSFSNVIFGPTPPGLTAPEQPTPTDNGTTLNFIFASSSSPFVPPHFFVPWSFQVLVNAMVGGNLVSAIPAPFFYISRNAEDPGTPPQNPTQKVYLNYDSSTGSFTIGQSDPLLGENPVLSPGLMLINTVFPLDVVVLLNAVQATPAIAFPSDISEAIAWNQAQPSWITDLGPTTDPAGGLQFTINQPSSTPSLNNAIGQLAGFHFNIQVGGDNGALIPSPDPILVNATIGDGN